MEKPKIFQNVKKKVSKDDIAALGALVEEGHPAIQALLEYCALKHDDIIAFLEGNMINTGFPDRNFHIFLGEARAVKRDIPEFIEFARKLYTKIEDGDISEE